MTGGYVLESSFAYLPDVYLVRKALENFFGSPFYLSVPLVDPFNVFESTDGFVVRNGRIISFGLKNNNNYFITTIIIEILFIAYIQRKLPHAVVLFHNILLSNYI